MSIDIEHLRQWIGRQEERHDVATASQLAGLSATLDRDDPFPIVGTELPPAGHWLYFLDRPTQSNLGPDGHGHRGEFLPPVKLPRRMWAGGRISFLEPLRIGESIKRISTVKDVTYRQGQSGDLVFVTVLHEIWGPAGVSVREEHDIVYRGEAGLNAPAARPIPAPDGAVWVREMVPDPVLLFRYSALTFNGHRIHYDLKYVMEEEGYPGLVVHGPLMATLLMDLCSRENPHQNLTAFSYRAVSPVFDTTAFAVKGKPGEGDGIAEMWIAKQDGSLAMQGRAEFGDV